MSSSIAATFCATIVDEWVRAGVTSAFVAPGSRSTPMALALASRPDMEIHVFIDERSASFAALGHGLAAGRPAVVLCTSGTASTHFHAAVVEADLSSVPLIACTADRPPELWDIGAPQTIDQTQLYGSSVRFFAEPGVPDEAMASSWRSVASRTVAEAMGWTGRPGPVQMNLSFRDPLIGEPGELPPGRPEGRPWHDLGSWKASTSMGATQLTNVIATLHSGSKARRGVIVAGWGADDPESILTLGRRLGWPILADHRSGCRSPHQSITFFDGLLRSETFAEEMRPEVILRFGEALSSKVLGQWITSSEADVISVVNKSRWSDPERAVGKMVAAAGVAKALVGGLPRGLKPVDDAEVWSKADKGAGEAVKAVVDELEEDTHATFTEIEIAHRVMTGIPPDGALLVSSSMPVRDVEWFGPNRDDIEVYANRGANGIDGIISTAIGIASTGQPTTVLIGDVAFLHDSSALAGLAARPIQLDIVIIDNDGGGIFSFLPQADGLDTEKFELLFGTPHGVNLAGLAEAHGLNMAGWPLEPEGPKGVRVSIVRSDRAANVAFHHAVNSAVIGSTTSESP
ncbi:MAG: 2-succinyl-5-enolpyruvyl-6-hydroxy-3-cyclohexene-1-carboxylic-acid synthase [Actinomycetia bacterium]|nr:2-succinyl-5-enolpyruvyl-6-hydroxy-3-cyclohexene-1-carboxylic-acid synthase [Actinomycetes bacterium]MCP4223697.1 2-succinyl-5-enolpyruvyl-6-hydroxy-3-cyclohexene-1-carboxylic-acid synthase [Actinomycetes bacterium]MCP5033336.1 2-succinyl-5-enolpyruvyl-6-hydroxy-3-cyclohexene-1-carboxylic-acid synthase [Actinomycetes bacterium]